MNKLSGSHYACLACLLALALAVRVGAAYWWQARLPAGARFEFGDSDAYWTLARHLAHGEPYQYGSPDARIFRTPGYPLLLAALFRAAENEPPVVWARWLSAALGTLAVAAVYGLGRQLFNPRTALIAATIAAAYPGAIADSVFVLSEAPFCPLMVAQLVAWAASWQAATTARAAWLAALAGTLAGAATLMRPGWLLFVPFGLAAGVVFGKQRTKHLRLGAVMLAALALAMTPWWVRNWQVVGHFVPTTLQVGASLYDGLNPQADGSSEMSFVARFQQEERDAERQAGGLKEPFEYRLDQRLRRAALNWAQAHPARVAELAGIKFLRIWNVWPNDAQFRNLPLRLVTFSTYVPVLALGIWGAWKMRHRGWPVVLAWLPAVYLTLLHLVFVGSIRYREPAMLSLMALSAAAILQGSTSSSDG
ncbi:MAG TPA: glycosyltransferase family 39 protein [Pirellulales bacterium]|nr:glycosyltransferase family 39 protein [Pirellulales bacterium]